MIIVYMSVLLITVYAIKYSMSDKCPHCGSRSIMHINSKWDPYWDVVESKRCVSCEKEFEV